MEEIAHEIEKMVEQKDALYGDLVKLLETERQYIVDMDVDALWKCAEEKKKISLEIVTVRHQLLALAEEAMGVSGMDAQSFSLERLLKAMPLTNAVKQHLKQLRVSIDTRKEEIAQRSRDNQIHVREYLSVIDDIMALAVEDSDTAQYNTMGHMPGRKQSSRLIDAEV